MLDRLGMIGVSWRQGGSESLAEFTLGEGEAELRLRAFAERQRLNELAYLATCNRVEILFARSAEAPSGDLRREAFELLACRAPEAGEAERRLRAWEGEGAAEHLFLIAAGLDSACVGETEIVGQVKSAYERAVSTGLSGPALDVVFEEALRIAARVRGETKLGEGRVSLAEIAVQALREEMRGAPGAVALIGVSDMTERAAKSLGSAGVPMLFVNRTAARAEALANRFHARHQSLDSFRADPPAVAGLLSATGAGEAILDRAALARIAAAAGASGPPLVVDMAIPPDVEPAAAEAAGLTRIDMDAITARAEASRAARLVESAQAREHVDAALEKLNDRFAELFYGPLLGALQKRYRHTAEEGMRRLLKKELRGLGDEQRAAIEAWCEALARRFAHIPCLGLRGLVHRGPEGSIEAFLSGLDTEFADELRAALGTRTNGRSASR